MKALQVPGKIFLIGEYSVIEGGRAVLAALKPPYIYGQNAEPLQAHPESPLGQFRMNNADTSHFSILESGLGSGFGSSTADLIAGAYFNNENLADSSSLQDWYRSRFKEASGADLAVQLDAITRGIQEIRGSLSGFDLGLKVSSIPISEFAKERIFILKGAPETKLRTHEDLKSVRPPISLEITNTFVDRFTEALKIQSMDGFSVLSEFADYLHQLERETAGAHEIRKELSMLPGVRGLKGCGAGLNDHFLVVMDDVKESSNVKSLEERANQLGLSLLGNLRDHLW